jgi:hypothetical protein
LLQTLKAEGPAVVDCVIPPDELPNVPHIELDRIENFAKAYIFATRHTSLLNDPMALYFAVTFVCLWHIADMEITAANVRFYGSDPN